MENVLAMYGCFLIGCFSGKWIGNWEWLWSVVEVIGECIWYCYCWLVWFIVKHGISFSINPKQNQQINEKIWLRKICMWGTADKSWGFTLLLKRKGWKSQGNKLRYGIPNPCYKTLYPCYETPNPCYGSHWTQIRNCPIHCYRMFWGFDTRLRFAGRETEKSMIFPFYCYYPFQKGHC